MPSEVDLGEWARSRRARPGRAAAGRARKAEKHSLQTRTPTAAFAGILLIALACAAGTTSAQTIGSVTNLSFGSFLAGGGGSVVIGSGGARTQTGGVLLVGQGSGAAAAQFNVVGTANATYSITLPLNNTVVLSDGNGNTMTVNSFVSSPAATGTLSGGGNQTVRVGATLIVGPSQAPGNYAGSFNITVNY